MQALKAAEAGSWEAWHMFSKQLIGLPMCSSTMQDQQSRKDPDARGAPVSRVHVDYTVRSGPARLHAVLPDEAEKLSKTPFAIIQVSMKLLIMQCTVCSRKHAAICTCLASACLYLLASVIHHAPFSMGRNLPVAKQTCCQVPQIMSMLACISCITCRSGDLCAVQYMTHH